MVPKYMVERTNITNIGRKGGRGGGRAGGRRVEEGRKGGMGVCVCVCVCGGGGGCQSDST